MRLLRNASEDGVSAETLQHRLDGLTTKQLREILTDVEEPSTAAEQHEDLIRAELKRRETKS